jgi:MFS family permease
MAVEVESRGRAGIADSLRFPEFRALWLTGVCSSVAQWTLLTGRSALAYDLSGSSSSVGAVVFASMLPYVFVPPIGGVLADRFDRRTVATFTLAFSLVTAALMAALTLTDTVAVWHLFVLSLLNGTARSIEMPATQSMVPATVPQSSLLNAVALTSVVTHGSRLMGPLVTLFVLGPFGAGGVFIVTCVMYVLGLAAMQRVRRSERVEHPEGENPLRQFAEGVRYSSAAPVVAMIILLVFFHCGLTMSYDALMPMYADEHTGMGGEHSGSAFSTLMMFVGAGAMAGTLLLAWMPPEWHRGRLLLGTALLSGLSPAALALADAWPPALVIAAVMGGTQGLFMALTNAFLQTATPDQYRGRVLSLFLMIGGGIMAFGNLAAGELGDRYGTAPMLLIPAVAFIAIVLVSFYGDTLRRVYARRALPVVAH